MYLGNDDIDNLDPQLLISLQIPPPRAPSAIHSIRQNSGTSAPGDGNGENSSMKSAGAPRKRQKLNLTKCQQCRVARKKCFPENRKWPDKCERCLKHKPHPLACSKPEVNENKRGPNKKKITTSQLSSSTSQKLKYPDGSDTETVGTFERDRGEVYSESESDSYDFAKPTAIVKRPKGKRSLSETNVRNEKSTTFMYDNLKDGEFRILQLHPGRMDEDIVCSFETDFIDPHGRPSGAIMYATISYYWAAEAQEGPEDGMEITLVKQSPEGDSQSRRWPIKSNLWTALLNLRHPTKERYFWVDALCIDYTKRYRNDPEEKTKQTKLKRHIFMGAKNLCFWLGDYELIKQALNFIPVILERVGSISKLIDDKNYIGCWNAFIMLLKNPAFHRLWLLQEVAISQRSQKQRVSMHCGNTAKDYMDFVDAVGIFASCRDAVADLFRKAPKEWEVDPNILNDDLIRLTELFVDISTNAIRLPETDVSGEGSTDQLTPHWDTDQKLLTLEALVSKLTAFGCGDSRDRVFSMLGLAKDTTEEVTIDYKTSVVQIYENFVYHTIKHSKSLDIICRPWAAPPESTEQSYPSWISSKNTKYTTAVSFVGLPGQSSYHASKCQPAQIVDRVPGSRGSLIVTGAILDTVAKLGDYIYEGMIFKQWLDLGGYDIEQHNKIPSDFWRTLVANLGSDGLCAPVWYRRALGHCITYRSADGSIDTKSIMESEHADSLIRSFLSRVQSVIGGRKFLVTKNGLKGLVPRETQHNDTICVLYGCSVPVVLRAQEDMEKKTSYWEVVGECYVHGMMNGEFFDRGRSSLQFELR
ncbi:heterokaryon incompatibility protein-domain-containing protein [Calycina marina]|uniref:Heterokaryon incompatibility protein-domain-containing protein n=1 Tax=Calycina marina TaxID=1763456 RepID=A0A9P7Z6I5_9HELO|nr:heterokaryon incompatibility protein-domain-containing protein [Calycina marina]